MEPPLETDGRKSRKFVLPTLQSVLIRSWDQVLMALGEGDYLLAWERTQTFFEDVIPPIVEKECLSEYERIRKDYESCAINSVAYVDTVISHNNGSMVLRGSLRPFLNKVKHSLFENKYLEDDKNRIDKDAFNDLEKTNADKMGKRPTGPTV